MNESNIEVAELTPSYGIYILHHNDFITNLIIIYFFIISFQILFIYNCTKFKVMRI